MSCLVNWDKKKTKANSFPSNQKQKQKQKKHPCESVYLFIFFEVHHSHSSGTGKAGNSRSPENSAQGPPWGTHFLQIDSFLVPLVCLSTPLMPSSAFPKMEFLLPIGIIVIIGSVEELV